MSRAGLVSCQLLAAAPTNNTDDLVNQNNDDVAKR